jgi:hypothetical protein
MPVDDGPDRHSQGCLRGRETAPLVRARLKRGVKGEVGSTTAAVRKVDHAKAPEGDAGTRRIDAPNVSAPSRRRDHRSWAGRSQDRNTIISIEIIENIHDFLRSWMMMVSSARSVGLVPGVPQDSQSLRACVRGPSWGKAEGLGPRGEAAPRRLAARRRRADPAGRRHPGRGCGARPGRGGVGVREPGGGLLPPPGGRGADGGADRRPGRQSAPGADQDSAAKPGGRIIGGTP